MNKIPNSSNTGRCSKIEDVIIIKENEISYMSKLE
jgi:hypothetical protein